MEGLKVSQMPEALSLTGDELVMVVQGGANKRVPSNLLKGADGQDGVDGADAVPFDSYQQEILSWTGVSAVSDGIFRDFFALSGIAIEPGGTIGLILDQQGIKFPALVKPSQVLFTTRITGVITGSSQVSREWRIQTRRMNGVTVVGSVADLKINGTDIDHRDKSLVSFTAGVTDPFSVEGVILGLLNSSGQEITLTSVRVLVQRIINPA